MGLGLKCLRCTGLAPGLSLRIERRWHPGSAGLVLFAFCASAAYSTLDTAAVQKHWSPPLLGRDFTAADVELHQRPIIDDFRSEHDSARYTQSLVAHVELHLVALVAAERLEGGVLLEDVRESHGLLHADVILKHIYQQYAPPRYSVSLISPSL
jgi:hypothetical protein